jgi:hypothetical protein
LTLLTSVNEDSKNTTLDELYPKHIEALEKAGLPLPTVYPTLNEAVEKLKIDIAEKESKEDQSKTMKKAKDNNRATYFCIGVSTGFWKTPISVTIRELSKKCPTLNSDLSKKVMMNIYDEEGDGRKCNCNSSSKCEKANVYTEATAAKSMLSTNSKIALLARATSAKHSNSSKTEQVITLQTSGNVSRLRRTTKLTRKMTHSRGIFLPTVLTVQTPVKSEPN